MIPTLYLLLTGGDSMVKAFWIVMILGVLWAIRALHVSNRQPPPPPQPTALPRPTHGPWTHARSCRCTSCK